MEKIDPYKHKERFLKWKENPTGRFLNLLEVHKKIILEYLKDMELGLNVSKTNKKGSRSYIRLNTLKDRICFILGKLEEREIKNILNLTEEEIHNLFNDFQTGKIVREDGLNYRSTIDFIKCFKAFWHWLIQKNRKIKDITNYLTANQIKPRWVYLTEEQVFRLIDSAKFKYKVIISFLYDSGVRAPTELINISVGDLNDNFKELVVRDEISKTFGRRIKLMISSCLLKRYIENEKLSFNDRIFKIEPKVVNRYLRRLAKRVLGDSVSPAGKKYSELTMHDFRHCSACYWRSRYKHTQGILYRFGWKKEDRLNYYTEFLGMRDTIEERDLLVGEKQTEMERRLIIAETDRDYFKEKIKELTIQFQTIQNNIFVQKTDSQDHAGFTADHSPVVLLKS
jgi:site-specific recombinase XerD